MTSSRSRRKDGVPAEAARALAEILAKPKFELVPIGSIEGAIDQLPGEALVTVSASPTRPIDQTVDLSVRISRLGFAAVPHLAARTIRDRSHLRSLLDRLGEAGITRSFVIGGDAQQAGAYPDALSLLLDMHQLGNPFTEIGIAGYPEGHPFIPDDALRVALHEKAAFASYVTTQMCFAPAVIVAWVEGLRRDGIELPVHLGIPGVADRHKLIGLARRIGIGSSLRYLTKNTGFVGRLVRPGGFAPDAVLDGLGMAVVDRQLGIEAVHIFTFNQVATTEAWRQRYLDSLAVDAGRS